MGSQSKNVIQALDGIRKAIKGCGCCCGIEFPQLSIGPVEETLIFNDNDYIVLKNFPGNPEKGDFPYFSSHGHLTDLCGKALPKSRVETAFPLTVPLPEVGLTNWPPEQPAPFDKPPVEAANTNPPGPSKQFYDFGDGNSIVTVGPSLPKIQPLKDGGSQFWVSSIGAISQGSGKYEKARGLASYVGSAYFPVWPANPQKQIPILQAGFNVKVAIVVKLVLKEYWA